MNPFGKKGDSGPGISAEQIEWPSSNWLQRNLRLDDIRRNRFVLYE